MKKLLVPEGKLRDAMELYPGKTREEVFQTNVKVKLKLSRISDIIIRFSLDIIRVS